MQAQSTDVWQERAASLLSEATEELADNPDDGVISKVSAALAALNCAWGDKPDPELEDYFHDRENPDDLSGCTCPPELVERGGWQSWCPVHGR